MVHIIDPDREAKEKIAAETLMRMQGMMQDIMSHLQIIRGTLREYLPEDMNEEYEACGQNPLYISSYVQDCLKRLLPKETEEIRNAVERKG